MPDIHPTAIVYEGTVLGEDVKVLEGAVVGKQPTLSPRSTAKREPLSPTDDRRRHDRLDGRHRLRRLADRSARDPGRPVLRARARRDRGRRRPRTRLVRRERHDDRRDDEDPGRRLHHRLLDARGARLHRPVRRDDERQLDGPDREAATGTSRGRRSAAARASAAARSSVLQSRSARRRSSAPARS